MAARCGNTFLRFGMYRRHLNCRELHGHGSRKQSRPLSEAAQPHVTVQSMVLPSPFVSQGQNLKESRTAGAPVRLGSRALGVKWRALIAICLPGCA